jgi:ZIP family zinc transporter
VNPESAGPDQTTAPATRPPPKAGPGLLAGALAIVPLALLLALVALFVAGGDDLLGPPVPADALGRLDVERITFRPGEIAVQVVNSGPAPLTVAQVTVNEAIWEFAIAPDASIPRLGRATIALTYPWLEGEPLTVRLITSNGLAFTRTVPIAVLTPEPEPAVFVHFALLGILVGVLPVYLGLLWLPLVRQLGQSVLDFCLALTVGLLIFLGVDAVAEALELAARVPGPYRGVGLIAIGLVGAILILVSVSRRRLRGAAGRSEAERALALAYLIAVAIGLHNVGEGLAIGSAYAVGELALGASLVIGFTIHNVTEGFGIVTPLASHGATLRHLLMLGLVAGAPTIIGTWLGVLAYSPVWATLFLAVGAGAVFQVVYELARLPGAGGGTRLVTPIGAVGLIAGLLVMYLTGLLVG